MFKALSTAATCAILCMCVHICSGWRDAPGHQSAKLAVDAARRFQDLFSQGACGQIYEEAAGYFRRMPREEWTSQCGTLHNRLGPSRKFAAATATNCGTSVLCIDGSATFVAGAYSLETAWQLTDGKAALLWLALRNSDFVFQMPPQPPPQLTDPPKPVDRKAPES
jgi:hypothetical protein